MNEHYREDKACCYFHPKEVLIGVCPLCLNERLLILAAKQGQGQGHLSSQTEATTTSHTTVKHRKLPKIFAFASLLKSKQFDVSDSVASTSPEDSFISIKFGDNGVASWEKSSTVSKVSLDNCNISWGHSLSKEAKKTSVVEHHHAKPRGGELRWRKRIGHLFQLIRWKRSSSRGSVCHVGSSSKLEGGRSGWIRTLTKRRT